MKRVLMGFLVVAVAAVGGWLALSGHRAAVLATTKGSSAEANAASVAATAAAASAARIGDGVCGNLLGRGNAVHAAPLGATQAHTKDQAIEIAKATQTNVEAGTSWDAYYALVDGMEPSVSAGQPTGAPYLVPVTNRGMWLVEVRGINWPLPGNLPPDDPNGTPRPEAMGHVAVIAVDDQTGLHAFTAVCP